MDIFIYLYYIPNNDYVLYYTQSCYVGGTTTVGECCATPLPVDTCATPGITANCVAKESCFGTIVVNDYNYEKVRGLPKGFAVKCIEKIPWFLCQS